MSVRCPALKAAIDQWLAARDDDAAQQLLLWTHAGGVVQPGLVRRRHPILAIVLPEQNRHGSTPENSAECRHCHFRAWVVAEPDKQLLRLQSSD